MFFSRFLKTAGLDHAPRQILRMVASYQQRTAYVGAGPAILQFDQRSLSERLMTFSIIDQALGIAELQARHRKMQIIWHKTCAEKPRENNPDAIVSL